jgi:hypothetical protein
MKRNIVRLYEQNTSNEHIGWHFKHCSRSSNSSDVWILGETTVQAFQTAYSRLKNVKDYNIDIHLQHIYMSGQVNV